MSSERVLLITTVPSSHLSPVLDAIGRAGAGVIGHYTHCAFTSPGTGHFKPDEDANPTVGEKAQVNHVEEVRIETFCERSRVKTVIAALRAAHPYEEPVYYLLPLLDEADFA